jgi:DNA mismatch repair protein MutL
MSDIIKLLPEAVANQIAAGEVVQRPASVVKELIENSIDSGASIIKLVVKDAGKTLVQVTDNGSGMSATDARLSFERHATSKIKGSDDLFSIRTKGFRGEALASIAAIAQVEMKTMLKGSSLGTEIIMEASKIKEQHPIQCPEGTSILVKNLFFNVPARRYFLKSDQVELRHIIDEFERVALTHPEVEFYFTHNGSEVMSLPKSTARQRIVHVFGNKYNEKLVPVEEETAIVTLSGFIGKPDASRKTRGEQFFFVNNRFIRNSYLHHAVMSAYQDLLPSGNFPLYFIFLEIDPAQIDINIHPTKTEIKFQDERAIYAILHAGVRRALGRHNISPTLDFEQDQAVNQPALSGVNIPGEPTIAVNHHFNPFHTSHSIGSASKPSPMLERVGREMWNEPKQSSNSDWTELFEITQQVRSGQNTDNPITENEIAFEADEDLHLIQFHGTYIFFQHVTGTVIVNQTRAHERVLYEMFLPRRGEAHIHIQKLLFPEELQVSVSDKLLISGWREDLAEMGWELDVHDERVDVTGIPAELAVQNIQAVFGEMLDQLRDLGTPDREVLRERIAKSLARNTAIRKGQMLTKPEMHDLLARLFDCDQPYFSPSGKPVMITLDLRYLEQIFK